MSVEEAIKEAERERRVDGIVHGYEVRVWISRTWPCWTVFVRVHGKGTWGGSDRDFFRRKSAEKYFEKLVAAHGL